MDENANWEVVAYSYPQAEHAIDDSYKVLKWDDVKVYEKLGTANLGLQRKLLPCTSDEWSGNWF